jgi:hypothetical protein
MKAPSEAIFEEMKAAAIAVWTETYSDEYGYVTEKINLIESVSNRRDNALVFFRMFDSWNQRTMMNKLSPEAQYYIEGHR